MNQVQLKNTIDILLKVVDLLYQENLPPAYSTLAMVLPQLETVIVGIEDDEEQKELIEKLKNALDAMEDGDSTLLADILQYDIIEQLSGYMEK